MKKPSKSEMEARMDGRWEDGMTPETGKKNTIWRETPNSWKEPKVGKSQIHKSKSGKSIKMMPTGGRGR
jgi:hypothetical protein